MKRLILLILPLVFSACATQMPLQHIADDLGKLADNPASQQLVTWADESLLYAESLGLNDIQLAQAQGCGKAIISVHNAKVARIAKIQEILRTQQTTINPLNLAIDAKFKGVDDLDKMKTEIISEAEYLVHECAQLFPTEKAMDMALKVYGF